ncbi:Serglycin [Bagarius yarrelli]|uniref:Serglycin n=1 Tax=Bagarius yarrelli TaxID=175774 RepID=A0A556TMI8_BAGYA|nr:Serglycin [Bagarius yarrelli]
MRLILSALILTYLLADNVLGAPQKGRYSWLKCNPDGQNANCIEKKGLSFNLFGKPQRISSRAVKDMDPVESSEESSETEESGDGSGDIFNVLFPESRRVHDSGPEKSIQNEPEGSGAELKYDNDIFPAFRNSKLSDKDLREDNIIA